MVHSAKRARRKRLAQEAQRRETPRPAHQMDPMDLSEPGTDREEEDDHEILFPPESGNPWRPYHRQRGLRQPHIVTLSIW